MCLCEYCTNTAPKPWLFSSVRKRQTCRYCTGHLVQHVLILKTIGKIVFAARLQIEMGSIPGNFPSCIPVNQALGNGTASPCISNGCHSRQLQTEGIMRALAGSHSKPHRSLISTIIPRCSAPSLLIRTCSCSASSASCQDGLRISKITRYQLARQAVRQRHHPVPVTRCLASGGSQASTEKDFVSTIRKFFTDQFLPVGLLLAMLIG